MRSQFRTVAITAVVALAMAACDGGSSPPPAPTVTLTSSATDVGIPGPPVTLTWSSTHATSCTASGGLAREPWDHQLGTTGRRASWFRRRQRTRSRARVAVAWRRPASRSARGIHRVCPSRLTRTVGVAERDRAADLVVAERHECRGFLGLPGTMPALPTSGSQMSAPLTETTRFQIICGNPVMGRGDRRGRGQGCDPEIHGDRTAHQQRHGPERRG